MRVVLLAGAPGIGKTTLVCALLAAYVPPEAPYTALRVHQAHGRYYPTCGQDGFAYVGIYNGTPYAGTDRFPRHASPMAATLVEELDASAGAQHPNLTVIAEGIRVTNRPFINRMRAMGDFVYVHLVTDDATLAERRIQRGQPDLVQKWTRGVTSTAVKLAQEYAAYTMIVPYTTPTEREYGVLAISHLLRLCPCGAPLPTLGCPAVACPVQAG